VTDRLESRRQGELNRLRQWLALNRSTDPFSIFAVLYMTAVMLELSEGWAGSIPGFFSMTLVTGIFLFFLLVAIGIISTGVTPVKFSVFLILTSAYFLIFQFPDVGNHVNIMLYCNIVMILTMAYAYVRRRDSVANDDYFEMIRPALRASLITVYFLAGFHKLNKDYFNPEVSCGADIFGYVASTIRTSILGVPVGLVLSAVGLFIVYILIRGGRFGAPGSRVFTLLVVLVVGGVFCGVLLVLLASPTSLREIGAATGIVIILWELIGSLLLAVPRFQVVMVPFSLAMHAILAVVGFVDFGTLAFALLFTFVPADYYQMLNRPVNLRFSGLLVDRAHVYFAITLIGAAYTGIYDHIYPLLNKFFVTGMLFNFAVLVFIWPILSALFSPSPPVWRGVSIFNNNMPEFLYLFPVLLVLYAMTSYVGLRTAGNFSMYSNLRTEGSGSNHFLLRDNPMKIWDYQQDVVRIIKIDDGAGAAIHHYDRFRSGLQLPVVEFRKWIYEWTQAGFEVPLTFEYHGRIHSTKDIVKDSEWSTDERTWEMLLLDFRAVQPDGPKECTW
jgi:hypothetical protein